jgi:hypothetical protein
VGSTSFIGRGMAWLTQKQQDFDSVDVVYVRGIERVPMRATLGTKLLKISDGAGGWRMQWVDMDFLIPVASLVLSGRETEPAKGDVIELPRGDETLYFEVLPLPGEPGWRDDPHGTAWRIHTKRVR